MIAARSAQLFPIVLTFQRDSDCAVHVFTKQNWFQGKYDKGAPHHFTPI